MKPLVSSTDRYLFNEGRHFRLFDLLGGHLLDGGGARFAVWAPNARAVSVVHDANGWRHGADPLEPQGDSGIWAGVVASAAEGAAYKFAISTDTESLEKADPVAFASEAPPATASLLADLAYQWHDDDFVAGRATRQRYDRPLSAYEVHLGSFARRDDGTFCSYEELAERLVAHVTPLGYTHVELMPVMEHPFYGSWGYQTSGYFAPTSRYGSPRQFMAFVDRLHEAGIGVLLDFVPSHFATDAFALGRFDGTSLYEHADPRRAIHPDWGSYEFNFARHEVRAFLISSACFWLERYHVDGLRVDAVASMLYLDYSREAGEWEPNVFGGREDLDAVSLLQEMNLEAHRACPGALTIAEESTAWPGVTRAVEHGGLGFDLKWDMGWMHDTLTHLRREPIYRRYHHHELTFRALYAFSERFVLALSHDEVVHGKGSLASKMPGDDWQRLANLRLLYGYQCLLPGKKLLFMGEEFGPWHEWDHERSLEWSLAGYPHHEGVRRLVADCNDLYRRLPALHERDDSPEGFAWVAGGLADDGVLAFLRFAADGSPLLAVVATTPVARRLRLGVPLAGAWVEVLNSDAEVYGGSGVGNLGSVEGEEIPWSAQRASLELTVPPLAVLALVPATTQPAREAPLTDGSARRPRGRRR